ncbi:hypothetical protein EVAR_25910_1 [Eumeta japonica]|uniref:Uncharacterized protein n=1 Tax=Eumeta variegata TaxID=151549 RepID=A0A4C1W4V5_EUMVA|nr:hypothetical protein EVAR_25910_1 [Eumeta japonica]
MGRKLESVSHRRTSCPGMVESPRVQSARLRVGLLSSSTSVPVAALASRWRSYCDLLRVDQFYATAVDVYLLLIVPKLYTYLALL